MAEAGRRRWSLRPADVGRLLAAWAASALALVVADALVRDLRAGSVWAWLAVAAVAGVLGLVIRPILIELSARIGWISIVLVALVGQAVVMYAAFLVVPGITATFGATVLASWIAAAVGTFVSWFTTAGTDDGLVTSLSARSRRIARFERRAESAEVADPDVDGVVFVQLDGVPSPVLRWAVQSGAVPTVRRWLASGDYVLREWTVQLPCTTPASQLGILHGTIDRVPAFRWYDRELGRMLVANRPADARIIEERASTGRGLLSDGGVSISNLFTGDAERALLTMSRVEVSRGSTQTRRVFAWFLASPSGFARSLTRTLAEIAKERWQARRQVRRGLDPRMARGWTFAVLRAVTNALLRDVNTALVAEEMRRGTKSIYVDYVDYDEIAHHAGMFRPESLASLDGLDRVLETIEALAATAPRRYRIVALSDHGQSQGKTFADRYGIDLGGLCAELMAERVEVHEEAVEGWGRAESLVADLGTSGVGGAVVRRVEDRIERETAAEGHHEHPADAAGDGPAAYGAEPVVIGSGNLGLLYIPGPQRLSFEELDERWPRLVSGLAGHPGIGFVAGVDRDGTPWAIGSAGRRDLITGRVTGDDPLSGFGEHAGRVLLRALLLDEAPELYVNSSIDPLTQDIAAFENLVGAHGGLGGWQDRGMLLVPTDLAAALPDRIEGADALHRELVGMLRACGHRRGEVPAA